MMRTQELQGASMIFYNLYFRPKNRKKRPKPPIIEREPGRMTQARVFVQFSVLSLVEELHTTWYVD